MKKETNKKDITPQEANQWLQLIITLASFIKSLFKSKKKQNETPNADKANNPSR